MKCAISLANRLEVDRLVSAVNRIVEDQIKKEGSLEDSLLVISIAKVADGQIILSLQP